MEAGGSGHGDNPCFCAQAAKGFLMQARSIVVSELAHVAAAQTPGLAGHNGGGYLAAGLDGTTGILDLGTGLRESFERDEGVCGVEADADQVNLGQNHHSAIVTGW